MVHAHREPAGDVELGADLRALREHGRVTEEQLDGAVRFAASGDDADLPAGDATLRAALLIARAAAPSPVELDTATVAACRASGVSAAALVELVTWLSVLQMLHRLTCFYAPA